MSTEDEMRKVEDAIDDLQTSVETLSYVVMNCTLIISGVILSTIPNIGSGISGLILGGIGFLALFNNLRTYGYVNTSKSTRRQRKF